MKRVRPALMVLLGALVALLAAASAAGDGGPGGKDHHPAAPQKDATTILVSFETPAAGDARIRQLGDKVLGHVGSRVHIVKLAPGDTVAKKVAEYAARPDVRFAEPNYIAKPSLATPNDPDYASQWGLAKINAPAGWGLYPGAYGSGMGGAAIAIVDTGIDSTHPDLAAHVVSSSGADCFRPTNTCIAWSGGSADADIHGTHVAGIAAALTNNSVGGAGLAFTSPLIPIRVLDGNGGTYAAITNGIVWAENHGAKVINMSLGGPSYSQALCNEITTAISKGIVVVAAAGNEGSSTASYPAACPGAIGVAATDSADGSPNWSNFGRPNVFLSAPGDNIYSTIPGGYDWLSGTSMASPFVAGLSALLLGQNPTFTVADVKRVLASTSDKVGGVTYGTDPLGTCAGCTWSSWYGYGRINAARALTPPVAAPTITSFTPGSGPVGTVVTLTGTNFANATATTLRNFNASFTVVSPTTIQATVPATGAPDGRWRVTTPGGTAMSAGSYMTTAAPAPPTLSGFSPSSGPVGTSVTLTGTNLSGATSVKLGTVAATFIIVSPTSISAKVPAGAASPTSWSVSTPAGTATSAGSFTTIPAPVGPPTISSFAPATGRIGITVTLIGTNFVNVSAVTLRYVNATYTVSSPTSITLTVPNIGATDGRWRVTTPSGTATSTGSFIVTP
jgi:thermitase